jgi:hypothetical protein
MTADLEFSRKLSAIKTAAERQRGTTFSGDLIDALNDVAAPDVDDTSIANLIVDVGSPTGAGLVAVWLGAGVEGGRDPDRTGRPIAEAFLKWSRTIATGPDDAAANDVDRDSPQPDEETIAGLQLLGQALVAHLARSPQLRRWLTETDGIHSELSRVKPYSIGAVWVLELSRQRSGKIVVLNVRHRIGVVVRYNNIATCFHLFTLLQGALAGVMPDTGEVSAQLLDIARGKSQGTGNDTAWWHYGPASATSPSLGASVWGEAGPDCISSVNGQQVLLLWPPLLQSRTWDTGFFSPILEASLPDVEVLEVLSSADVDAWWLRLGLDPTSGL